MSKIGRLLVIVITTFTVVGITLVVAVNCMQFRSMIDATISDRAQVGADVFASETEKETKPSE